MVEPPHASEAIPFIRSLQEVMKFNGGAMHKHICMSFVCIFAGFHKIRGSQCERASLFACVSQCFKAIDVNLHASCSMTQFRRDTPTLKKALVFK